MEHVLRYSECATRFDSALPIGNSRLGAMVYGQMDEERVLINESGMWSGGRQQSDRDGASAHLPRIRKLLLSGKNLEAEALFREHFTCMGAGTAQGSGANTPFGCYQMLGHLVLNYFHTLSYSHQTYDHADKYERTLDLETAMARVSFPFCHGELTREYFCSSVDEVIAIRISATKPGQVNVGLGLDRPERREVNAFDNGMLIMRGTLPNGNGAKGVNYFCAVKAAPKGGRMWADSGRLYVENADELLLTISATTSISGFPGARNLENIQSTAQREARSAAEKGWNELLRRHLAHYQPLYKRVSLEFKKPQDMSVLDLPERIRRCQAGGVDVGLIELYYNYSRYLLISSSRPGGMPANLQGIWADEIQTPWNGDWHLNAQQMTYWTAERANLSECHMPYLELTRSLVQPGGRTARCYYGTNGWVVHTCTNAWGFTSPCEDASWGSTIGSGAWQCHHIWEHYAYTRDLDYLRDYYPVLIGAAQFYLGILVRGEQHGYLVTAPSSSPENQFLTSNGAECSLCAGPSYDSQLVTSLFTHCLRAIELLCIDEPLKSEIQSALRQLPPIEIASDGRIKEWLEEYEEVRPYHRHLSHLWGVFPGELVSPDATPELAEAAHKSLIARGRTTAGWAIAYRLCVAAKLGDAERAWSFLMDALKYATSYNLLNLAFHCDETLPEPLAPDIGRGRYPFQIDGNMGVAAGIMQMLVDDRLASDGLTVVNLLPSVPVALNTGSFEGLKLRGGFSLELRFECGKPTWARVTATKPGAVMLRFGDWSETVVLEPDGVAELQIAGG